MELHEDELKNVIAGTNQQVAEEQVLKNEQLFSEKKINELKQQRQEIIENLEKENELDNYSK